MFLTKFLLSFANIKTACKTISLLSEPDIETVLSEGTVGTNNLTVSYTPTDNYFQFYVFELLSPYSVQRKDRNDSDHSVVFSGLQGGTKYTVRVMAVSGDQSSPPLYILIRTGKLKLPIFKKKVNLLMKYYIHGYFE